MEHIKNVNKGLENKIIQLQQKLDAKVRVVLRSPCKGGSSRSDQRGGSKASAIGVFLIDLLVGVDLIDLLKASNIGFFFNQSPCRSGSNRSPCRGGSRASNKGVFPIDLLVGVDLTNLI